MSEATVGERKQLGVVAWLLIALVGFAALVGAIALTRDDGVGSDPNNSVEAKAQCEDFVKARLKAPSTADFELSAAQAGSGWTVTGTVDSENSFGAKLRSPVRCVLHFAGDTAYLDDISVG